MNDDCGGEIADSFTKVNVLDNSMGSFSACRTETQMKTTALPKNNTIRSNQVVRTSSTRLNMVDSSVASFSVAHAASMRRLTTSSSATGPTAAEAAAASERTAVSSALTWSCVPSMSP